MKVKLAEGLQLRSYQLQDAALFWKNKRFANLSEMGAGKTLPTAVALTAMIRSGRVQKALLVMPPILLDDWKRCFERQLDMDMKVYVYHGTQRSQALAIKAEVVLTSYQLFVNEFLTRKPKGYKLGRPFARRVDTSGFFYRFLKTFRTAMALDEASAIRRTESRRCFAAQKAAELADCFYLLTGNPTPNGAINAYPLLSILIPDAYISELHFKHEHCIMSGGPFPTVVGYKGLERLSELMSQVSIRHLKLEVMSELPAKEFVVRNLDMSPEHTDLYSSMLVDQFLQLPTGEVIDMANAFALIMRSRQIASNPMTLGFEAKSPKFGMLEQDLEWIGADKKVVIFVEFVKTAHSVKEQCEKLGYKVAMMADTTKYNPLKELRRFQEGDANIIVVNPASGGLGVNLSVANYNIFFEYSYNLEHHDQALERSHRTGLVGPLTIVYYVTTDTIEESILEVLQRKKTMSSDLLRDPVQLRSFVKFSEKVVSKLDPQMGIRF